MPRFLATLVLFTTTTVASAAERPNILWITAEDMSATLGCYGDEYSTSPNIDALAKESVRYTHAFATAPVCSPSRSTLITGCYATSLGTHQMRSAFPIPDFIKGFPSHLRAQGYFTTNNVKTDYNTANEKQIIEASWDQCSDTAHWRNRKNKDQPFFSIFNLMTTHQSRTMVWPREQFVEEVQSRLDKSEIHDAEKAPLPPYYPDTPIIRRTVARYYDCVTAMDKQVGEILQQLADDDLVQNTIVFFYSDHGSGMPRHKRCLYDSGMHVPLLIRFPEKWKHLAPKQPGETTDRLVSFVDFGPTVLSLAEVDVPEYMQGEPFLGKAESAPREYVFGHRDRIDEAIDCSRSVRTKRYLYIRNYMPHLGWNQPSAWPDVGAINQEIHRLTDREKMTDAQWQFAGPTRAVTELYDCEKDPHNLHNLATMSKFKEYGEILVELALEGSEFSFDSHDWGAVPEQEAWRIARVQSLWNAAQGGKLNHDHPITSAFDTAAAAPLGGDFHVKQKLASGHASVRYWGAMGGAQREEMSKMLRESLVVALRDTSSAVRISVAQALGQHGEVEKALPTLIETLNSKDLTTVLYAARTIELLGDDAKAAVGAMQKTLARAEAIRAPESTASAADQDMAMFIEFSTRAFLEDVRDKPKNEEE